MSGGAAIEGGEFGAIARHFAPLAGAPGRGLRDDAAVLPVPPGQELVLTTDTLIAGVHFYPNDPPGLIARKALRANLSDLAAMAARPCHYLLALSLPAGTSDAWLAAFAAGLAADQAVFGLTLIGGDTTRTPGPLTLSLTLIGAVPAGQAVGRGGACAGDAILVSGTIGDAGRALALRGADGSGACDPDLAVRLLLPTPRLGLLAAMPAGAVHAAIDVSDGLLADLGHIAAASGVGCEIGLDRVPLSPALRAAGGDAAAAITAGDDYELLIAAQPDAVAPMIAAAAAQGVALTLLGHCTQGPARVLVRDAAGQDVTPQRTGWTHF